MAATATAEALPNLDDLLDRVIEVTGVHKAEAEHLLGACNNDVDAAVALYFEGGGGGIAAGDLEPPNNLVNMDEDEVRAPIAPIREQLITPDMDNFLTTGHQSSTTGRLTRVSSQRVKVCPLRDFAREGALMEEQLQNEFNAGKLLPSTAKRVRSSTMLALAQSTASKSSSRLGDLFRPPTDIRFAGTFQSARNRATSSRKWLLVNVQSDNFDSQLLNRDVWSDREMRKLIAQHFLLWQIDSESSEGRRFVAFYHCGLLPYVCIIDPRTGEETYHSNQAKLSKLLPNLKQFLTKHKDFNQEIEDNTPSTSKRTKDCVSNDKVADDKTTTFSNTAQNNNNKRPKLIELSEEDQIALAIRNSMRENGGGSSPVDNEQDSDGNEKGSENDFRSGEEFTENDTKSIVKIPSYEEQLGSAKDELTMLKLRLFNAEGSDEMIQLRWPSNTKLEVLRLYITQQHGHIPDKGYKLVCVFPRKTLETNHDTSTLKELGLHPSANLHVTLDE